jgi:eukaryotic-like serine/threonine-protein kinase
MDSAQADVLVASLHGKEVGGWCIERFLGKGKSAVVLACSRGAEVGAIKVFHPELVERYGRTTQLERILREKSLVGASHPNLVNILDGGECPVTSFLYVVMECIPYPNMHEALSDIPSEMIPVLIAQIASAARFLEDRNLVHRDIKPENIAVSFDFSKAILLDLGVLRPIGISNLTDVDQRSFIGTLRYGAPEFLQRQEEETLNLFLALLKR